ncbi:MAG TPA: PepSY-associated TM helix domain-containing protein [Bryobacteraceae bacterium]|nr:PepSY-associated TM helix domain-containing protein [Bryobacteraceae bacterium]
MGFFQSFVRRPQQVALRRLNFVIHLWVGIVLAIYMIVIGVTGSILVFQSEIERAGLKPWQGIRVTGAAADIATVVTNLRQAYPRWHLVSVLAPGESDATFVAVLEGRGRIRVASDPNSGKVLGQFPAGRNWLDFTRELHETLLLSGHTGRLLNGIAGGFLLLLNATGLVIWWPGIRNWRRALMVDFRRNWRRVNWDLHSAAGFWTLAIVSFWAITGMYFAWPRQTFRFVNSFSKIISARPPAIIVAPEIPNGTLDLRALVERARVLDPGTKLAGIAFPYSRRAPLAILMSRRDSPGREYDDTVYFNPYNGEYISTWRYGVNQSLGDWLIWLQVPLHFGTSWGLAVKLVWGAAGLAIPLLTITGLLMYWNRVLRRKWKHLRKHAISDVPAAVTAS